MKELISITNEMQAYEILDIGGEGGIDGEGEI
jgi:hypothetical protein